MAVGDGLVRLRANQLGKQTLIHTPVNATRRMPWSGLATYDPQRNDPEVDTGSLDPWIRPWQGAPVVEWNPTGLLTYDELPYRLSAGLKGGVSPSVAAGAATWTYQIASLTADPFDYWTLDSGDDQSATDGLEAYGGVADSLEETMGEELGPIEFSDAWVFAAANLATDRTAALTVDEGVTFVMGDETDITVDTTPGSIGVTPINDAFHSYTGGVNNNLDRKRFANGSNGRRKIAGYGRGGREIPLTLRFAKNAATMAMFNSLDDDSVDPYYIQIRTVSPILAAPGVPFSYTRRGAFRLFNATPGEIGGNATIDFEFRAFYDSTLGYAYRAVVVNQLTAH